MVRFLVVLLCSVLSFSLLPAAAAPTAVATALFNHHPTPGNHRPVYKNYRGHNRHRRGFLGGLFKHRAPRRKVKHVAKAKGPSGQVRVGRPVGTMPKH